MRFGHDFHRHVMLEWHQCYVDFILLKRRAKPPLDGNVVYDLLEADLSKLERFFKMRFRTIDTEHDELCMLFDLPKSGIIPNADQVCPYELTLLLEAFHEFRLHIRKLHWFARVNSEAVDRIFAKLVRREQQLNSPYSKLRARWETLRAKFHTGLASRLQKYGSMIDSIKHGLKDPHRKTGKSLYLKRAFDGLKHADAVIEAAQAGDYKVVVGAVDPERTRFYVDPDTIEDLAADTMSYAVMLRPKLAVKLLALEQEGLLWKYQALQWAILALGRRLRFDSSNEKIVCRHHHASDGLRALQSILKACPEGELSVAAISEDKLGRLPVHYAIMYGVTDREGFDVSMFLEKCGNGSVNDESLEVQDVEGVTPIELAVLANRPKTLDSLATLLENDHSDDSDPENYLPGGAKGIAEELLPVVLINAEKTSGSGGCTDLPLFERLVTGGKTALEVVRSKHSRFVAMLFDWISWIDQRSEDGDAMSVDEQSDFDIADRRGWTALFHACASGQYDIAKRLLELGCSQTRTDDLGWTALEYAVLHGHLAVASLFEPTKLRDMAEGPARMPEHSVSHPKRYCAKGERVIVASLGSERVNEVVTEVSLPYCCSPYSPDAYDGFFYSLEISATGTTTQPRVIRLPILDDQINDPVVFPIPAAVEPQLIFRVIRQGAGDSKQDIVVGSGTALLEGNTRQFGAGRQSLIREQTIPILEKETMAPVGTVTFTFMVANHFPHLQTPRNVHLGRKNLDPPALIGHRGLGMNLKTHEYLQIGENTVESFLSAAKLGASYVEFDYQVTKDHEAVIFHDFSLSQSGTDVPVHDVTLDQFMYAGNIQSPHGNPLSILGPVHSRDDERSGKRKRSRSDGGHFEAGAIQIRDRMKHTVDYKLKGFKPNTRGDFIQDSFATLKELLQQVPEHVGFDIEIKYPRLHEATDAGVAPVAIELNTFVDVALTTLHHHAGNRPIILSSFTPEICILLSLTQKAYPVFFITNAGKVPMIDAEHRAASVKIAVRFAKRWNLAGVVFSCEALLMAPRLVGYVKNRGLVCATYGTPNNVPENVRRQVASGVDVIIADRVRVVAETLSEGPVVN